MLLLPGQQLQRCLPVLHQAWACQLLRPSQLLCSTDCRDQGYASHSWHCFALAATHKPTLTSTQQHVTLYTDRSRWQNGAELYMC